MRKIFAVIFGILFLMIVGLSTNCQEAVLGTQNLKVYIPPKNVLSLTMKHAFMDWQKHTNNNFTFEYVNTKSTANIEVLFVEGGIFAICKIDDALGCTHYKVQQTLHGNKRIKDATIYISMRDNQGKFMTKNQVYTIMLHEIGHALGLPHSQDPTSLMYEGTNAQMAEGQEIRQSDIDALYKLYGITPKR